MLFIDFTEWVSDSYIASVQSAWKFDSFFGV